MKILRINYNKELAKAPKYFNYLNYIEKTNGALSFSPTPIVWKDGDKTLGSWQFSGNSMRADAKTAKDAIKLHYVLNRGKLKNEKLKKNQFHN